MSEKKHIKPGDYEKIGRAVEDVFASGYANKRRLYGFSFMRGLTFGLGVTIGGTIVVAFILYFLSQLSDIPFFGDIADKISNSIEDSGN
ncbi:MAG TPA: DUF5665 domain-containing protein [Candidatus Saccharimonadales bacterium]|jgi:hypothetical protein